MRRNLVGGYAACAMAVLLTVVFTTPMSVESTAANTSTKHSTQDSVHDTASQGIAPIVKSVEEVAEIAVTTDSIAQTPTPVIPTPKTSNSTGSAPIASVAPGTSQAIAAEQVAARGWGSEQLDCLVSLWNKESGWSSTAHNASSGAYGIPQALPGSKMASAGADWQTNPATQITWGLGYIEGRYGTPCGAWAKSQASGWY